MNAPTYTINTILLKGELIDIYNEARVGAGQTIYPGMLIEKDSDTTYLPGDDSQNFNATYKPHATATGAGEPLVALEKMYPATPDDSTVGTGTVDQSYVAGELMHLHHCQPGNELYMYLKTGNHALLTSLLVSAGDGTLQVGTTNPMFKPLEDVNNTSGSKTRIKVRKL